MARKGRRGGYRKSYRPKTRTRWRQAPRRRSGRSKGSKTKLHKDMIVGGAVYGYLQEQTDMLQSLPEAVQPTSRKGGLLFGGLGWYLNKHAMKSKHLNSFFNAVLVVEASKFGASNFKLEGDDDGWDASGEA